MERIVTLRSVENESISFLNCSESSGTSDEVFVMKMEQQPQVI